MATRTRETVATVPEAKGFLVRRFRVGRKGDLSCDDWALVDRSRCVATEKAVRGTVEKGAGDGGDGPGG